MWPDTYLLHAVHNIVRDLDLGRDEEVRDIRAVRDTVRPPSDVADPGNREKSARVLVTFPWPGAKKK